LTFLGNISEVFHLPDQRGAFDRSMQHHLM
jgi:hypothetical protein